MCLSPAPLPQNDQEFTDLPQGHPNEAREIASQNRARSAQTEVPTDPMASADPQQIQDITPAPRRGITRTDILEAAYTIAEIAPPKRKRKRKRKPATSESIAEDIYSEFASKSGSGSDIPTTAARPIVGCRLVTSHGWAAFSAVPSEEQSRGTKRKLEVRDSEDDDKDSSRLDSENMVETNEEDYAGWGGEEDDVDPIQRQEIISPALHTAYQKRRREETPARNSQEPVPDTPEQNPAKKVKTWPISWTPSPKPKATPKRKAPKLVRKPAEADDNGDEKILDARRTPYTVEEKLWLNKIFRQKERLKDTSYPRIALAFKLNFGSNPLRTPSALTKLRESMKKVGELDGDIPDYGVTVDEKMADDT